MSAILRVGRNQPCPCGSGIKFKFCCERQTGKLGSAKRSPLRLAVGGIAGLGVAVLLAKAIFSLNPGDDSKSTARSGSGSTAAQTALPPPLPVPRRAGMTPQPPGPVPEGKVWSPEHGHWHDLAAQTSNTAAAGPYPQPPGPAPEGKVWSPEHGHWHNLPTPTAPDSSTDSTVAPTPVPAAESVPAPQSTKPPPTV